jgi:excisionase family DNA binding protein
MSDKLLTLQEAADFLAVSEDSLRRLVKKGAIPAYHVGGVYLRFKEEQLRTYRKSAEPTHVSKPPVNRSPMPVQKDSFFSKISDFFYFNDFYIISAVLVWVLLYIIINSIR